MSVKRACGFLRVASIEHEELGRLLSRKVIRTPARSDSPVTAFITTHQRTA